MKRHDTVVLIVLLVTIIYVAKYPTNLGLPSSLTDDLIDIMPGLIVSFLSLKGYRDARGPAGSLAFFTFSIGMAFFVDAAYDIGLVTSSMLDGSTIAELQTWIIILGGVLSGIDYFRR